MGKVYGGHVRISLIGKHQRSIMQQESRCWSMWRRGSCGSRTRVECDVGREEETGAPLPLITSPLLIEIIDGQA